jgi:hypothetical protein
MHRLASTCAHKVPAVQMEEQVQERVEQKKNELSATYDERIRNYEQRLASLAFLPRECLAWRTLESRICSDKSRSSRTSSAIFVPQTILHRPNFSMPVNVKAYLVHDLARTCAHPSLRSRGGG